MTDEEAKQAFLKQCSVVERNRSARSDIHYKCISAIIYRYAITQFPNVLYTHTADMIASTIFDT